MGEVRRWEDIALSVSVEPGDDQFVAKVIAHWQSMPDRCRCGHIRAGLRRGHQGWRQMAPILSGNAGLRP